MSRSTSPAGISSCTETRAMTRSWSVPIWTATSSRILSMYGSLPIVASSASRTRSGGACPTMSPRAPHASWYAT